MSEPSAPAATARPTCREAVVLTDGPDGTTTLGPEDSGDEAARREPERVRVTWRGDLDGDGREDRIVMIEDACGNWGECLYLVLRHCEGDSFATLWGPDYALSLAVTDAADAGFRVLKHQLRADELDEHGRAPAVLQTSLRMTDGRYRPAGAPVRVDARSKTSHP